MSTFRLEVVLRLRKLAEEGARLRLSQALAAHRLAGEAMTRVNDDVAAERWRLQEMQRSAATPAGTLRDTHDGVEFAERSMAGAAATLETATQALLESRSMLATATRRRDVVERLRDRAALAIRKATERKSEAEIAEFTSVRHAWLEIENSLR
jgi:flagellar export protein FliJ